MSDTFPPWTPTGPWIQLTTSTGYQYGHRGPIRGMSLRDDVARPLSRIPRFTGHTSHLWSVAAHQTVCCRLLAADLAVPLGLQFRALVHDVAECLVNDIPAPLKRLLPEWAEIEDAADEAIWNTFGWPIVYARSPDDPTVKMVDLAVMEAERRVLKSDPPARWPDSPNPDLTEEAVKIITDMIRHDEAFDTRAQKVWAGSVTELLRSY